ncbi:bifunctional UDP-N-acetylglucosamine diphosphorylase/glucosamine-1-phosphate N-acetyltransferase GlmU [Helicobacter sp. 23-1046]
MKKCAKLEIFSHSVVILCAGAGTRMKSHTPKVLHTLCGRSMISLILRESLPISDDIHIVLYHQADEITDSIMREFSEHIPSHIHFHTQDHKNYPGTGGALMGVKCKYEKILVLNGDMPLVRTASLQALCARRESIVLSVFELANPQGYGRVVLDSKKGVKSSPQVQAIIEEKDANAKQKAITTLNAGVYVFEKSLLGTLLPHLSNANAQQEYYLTDIIALARDANLLKKCKITRAIDIGAEFVNSEEFMGINSKAHLADAQEVLLARLRNEAMQKGVRFDIPQSVYIECGVEFIGECVIENGVRISGECVIEDSHIKAHSVVESSTIKRSDVGPCAHIRPKCEIIDTHIGNFVEVKAGKLNGVKAGHLSYLGDCEIGRGSNVGAGVITCNYDGKQKHKTLIGENVFIGSDCQLVAPISIESSVIIAAGTTVTQNIPSGALAISRTKQSNKLGFFARFFGGSK